MAYQKNNDKRIYEVITAVALLLFFVYIFIKFLYL